MIEPKKWYETRFLLKNLKLHVINLRIVLHFLLVWGLTDIDYEYSLCRKALHFV